GEAHFLHMGMESADPLGEFGLHPVRRAEGEPVGDGPLHLREYIGMPMADDHRPPGAEIVDVASALDVPKMGAFGAGNEARRAADGPECAHRRVDPTDKDSLGTFEFGGVTAHGDIPAKASRATRCPLLSGFRVGTASLALLELLAQFGLEHLAVVVLRQCIDEEIALGPLEAGDQAEAMA